MKHGVPIAPGHVYVPEEFGWFRITFTVGKEALREGLQRVKESLAESETELSWTTE
jgi:bifunctional pyridoxal-dependent enzyme with beta-cystathionase and maltose regulon repressor activities